MLTVVEAGRELNIGRTLAYQLTLIRSYIARHRLGGGDGTWETSGATTSRA
jgi:hypothetical protein